MGNRVFEPVEFVWSDEEANFLVLEEDDQAVRIRFVVKAISQ